MSVVVPVDLLDVAPDAAAVVVRVAAGLGEVTCLLGAAPDAARLADLGAAGAAHVVWAPLPDDRVSGPTVTALAACVGPNDLVLVPDSRVGAEVAARLALRLGRPVSTGAARVVPVDGGLQLVSGAFAGTWQLTTQVPFAAVVTVGSVATAADPVPLRPDVVALDVDLTPAPGEPVVVATAAKPTVGGPRLTEATIVVSGGRGTEGDFHLLEELAALLGGAVGSSRVAVDLGWAPPERQVGQTGTTVAPDVYIAAGISGAVQHLAGMSASKAVIAINLDADAPIFRNCDLGIVGDLHTVVAEAVDLLRRADPVPA